MTDADAGAHEASPMRTPSRRANICPKFCAMPDAAVRRLHSNTPADSMNFRGERSASRPSGIPTTAYNRMNAVPSAPKDASLRSNSFRIGSPTAPKILRSKKFNALIANSTIIAYQTAIFDDFIYGRADVSEYMREMCELIFLAL